MSQKDKFSSFDGTNSHFSDIPLSKEKETAIKFAEWLWSKGYERYHNTNGDEFWLNVSTMEEAKTLDQLYDKFIKEKT
jgi:hypothetical protein